MVLLLIVVVMMMVVMLLILSETVLDSCDISIGNNNSNSINSNSNNNSYNSNNNNINNCLVSPNVPVLKYARPKRRRRREFDRATDSRPTRPSDRLTE